MNNLGRIKWTDEYSIGNNHIDSDHKELINIYNDLYNLINSDGTQHDFARILSRMSDYTFCHFNNEEIYMQEFGYPKLAEHKQIHRKYIYKVAMYNIGLFSKTPTNPKEVLLFLKKWWTNHILIEDMEYEKYKNEKQFIASYKGC